MSWTPNPGAQTEALSRSEFEIMYGGARGGGKTDAGLAWLVEEAYIKNREYRGLVIRRNADDLSDWVARAKLFYQPQRAKFAGNPPTIKFPSGAMIRTGHLKDSDAYMKYQGHEYQKIVIEELTQIPRESDYEMLISSARSTVVGLPAQVFCTTNPGNVGHVWVKQRFVDVARNKTYFYADGKRSRIFIPSTVEDNPHLMEKDPTYVNFLDSIKDEKLMKAWRYGNWDTFSGQFFDMWDPRVHVIEPFVIPSHWVRFRGLDWGHTAESAVGWVAIDEWGTHYMYREFYEKGNAPSIVAKKVLAMEAPNERILDCIADPSIWAKNQFGTGKFHEQETARAIVNALEENGLYCSKANNDRINGWTRVKELLHHDTNCPPRLKIFNTCKNIIRVMPSQVHDKHNVEDLNTDGEDHLPDMIRYLLMHTINTAARPYMGKSEREQFFERLDGINMDDLASVNWDDF